MKTLLDISNANNGYVTSTQVTQAGIPRRKLTEAIKNGELIQVERGLYASYSIWEDPFFATQYRFSRGIFSDDTALYLHGMTDRVPFSFTMTFPRSYNASSARAANITCRSCSNEIFELGLTKVVTPQGNLVRAYDLERTLCDMVRGQKITDTQILIPAIRLYTKRKDCNPTKLIRYARELGVEKKMRTYLEVLL